MTEPTDQQDILKARKEAEEMLRRIGWHPSELKQIEVYARMSPARKMAQMMSWRAEQMRFLRARLRQEHPGCSDEELAQMVREHLDILRATRN